MALLWVSCPTEAVARRLSTMSLKWILYGTRGEETLKSLKKNGDACKDSSVGNVITHSAVIKVIPIATYRFSSRR